MNSQSVCLKNNCSVKYFNDYTLDIDYGSSILIIYANRIEIINGVEQAMA